MLGWVGLGTMSCMLLEREDAVLIGPAFSVRLVFAAFVCLAACSSFDVQA